MVILNFFVNLFSTTTTTRLVPPNLLLTLFFIFKKKNFVMLVIPFGQNSQDTYRKQTGGGTGDMDELFLFGFFFGRTAPHGMGESHSPDQGWNYTPCSASAES